MSRLAYDSRELRFCYVERDERSTAHVATGSSVSWQMPVMTAWWLSPR